MNDRLTDRKLGKDVAMQGSVLGSMKCKTTLDIMNQFMVNQEELKYQYKRNTNIEIGVLGMIDIKVWHKSNTEEVVLGKALTI